MKQDLFRLCKNIFYLLILFYAFDFVIGHGLEKLYFKTKNPYISKINYSFYHTTEDVLIMGSSRGESHYIPKIISDSLNMTCFNTAQPGMGIFYSYSVLKATLKRYKPRLIIYDLAPNIIVDNIAYERNNILLPYCHIDQEILKIITLKNKFENVKLLSRIYPYNSQFFFIVRGLFPIGSTKNDSINKGYHGLYNTTNTPIKKRPAEDYSKIDTNQLFYFKKFVSEIRRNKIQLLVVVSPMYYVDVNEDPIIEKYKVLCNSYNYALWDYSHDCRFHEKNEYFYDQLHLNSKGSEVFSLLLVTELKKNI
jgi:hypothetical protein